MTPKFSSPPVGERIKVRGLGEPLTLSLSP